MDLKIFKKINEIARPNYFLIISSIIFLTASSFFSIFGISLVIPITNSLSQGGDFLENLKIPYIGDFIKPFVIFKTNDMTP
jgi:hypothetical protein